VRIVKFFFKFIKKWGLYGVFAIITLYIPTWLGFVTGNKDLQEFGIRWVIIWAAPFPPAWLVIFLIAGFYKWVFKRFVDFIKWIDETVKKIHIQNQLMAYLTSDEIQIILDMAIKVHEQSSKKLQEYRDVLRKERLTLIDDQFTIEANKEK
jgi:hypothetical protein